MNATGYAEYMAKKNNQSYLWKALALASVVIGVGFFISYSMNTTPVEVVESPERTQESVVSEEAMMMLADESYKSQEHAFEIMPPKDWVADENIGLGVVVSFSHADQTGEYAGVSINVVAPQPTDGASMEEIIEQTLQALPTVLTDYSVVDNVQAMIPGHEAHFIGGTFVQGQLQLRNKQLIVIDGDQAYVVTATAPASSWGKHADMLEASMLTFKTL